MTMKVTITDRAALEALSWEALKAYMDASEWQRVEDITGKAAAYQYAEPTGRRWEILVPLRRDLGDYVSRMADAVTILARIEDRSELDVYEDLRRLGETPAEADEATHAVHEKIRRWLAEEGWHIREVDDPQSLFNVMVTLKTRQQVNIFQRHECSDQITVALHVEFLDTGPAAPSLISADVLGRIQIQIERNASMMGLDVERRSVLPIGVQFSTDIPFSELSKDRLIMKMLLVLHGVSQSLLMIVAAREWVLSDRRTTDSLPAPKPWPDNVRILPVRHAAAG